MRKSKFTESQIAFVLRQADEGTAIDLPLTFRPAAVRASAVDMPWGAG